MRHLAAMLLPAACVSALGCAAGMVGPSGLAQAVIEVASETIANDFSVVSDEGTDARPPAPSPFALVQNSADAMEDEETDEGPPSPVFEDDPDQTPPADVFLPSEPETVVGERADASPFKPGPGESDIDRFVRPLTEVPVDIRPTAGAMPADVSLADFPDEPVPAQCGPAAGRFEVSVAYSPWTICYRPLYFEEIPLERYGITYGILQPAISGAHFFGSVAALPYKMTVRPPRSCECSNGFSRCGDLPLPGYGVRQVRLDAALVEAGIVAGIVVALP